LGLTSTDERPLIILINKENQTEYFSSILLNSGVLRCRSGLCFCAGYHTNTIAEIKKDKPLLQTTLFQTAKCREYNLQDMKHTCI
jgi:hypothetical protein